MLRQAIPIQLTPELSTQVEERGPSHVVVDRDLSRLYMLYRRALDEIALTEQEARLIYEAFVGISSEVPRIHTAALLAASVRGALLERHLDEKYPIDGHALVEKLRNLNEIQALAIIDAVERLAYGSAFQGVSEEEALREAFRIIKR